MNATKLVLLQNQAEAALAGWNVQELSWHNYVSMVTGYLFWLGVALVALFWIVDALSERRWLRKPSENECEYCVPPHWFCAEHRPWSNSNHTATLSFAEFKAAKTNHPCITPVSRKSQPLRETGGGDKTDHHEARKKGLHE